MLCKKCGFNRMVGHQPINEELGILQTGMSCPVCGNWVEPEIIPVRTMNKQEFKISSDRQLRSKKGLEAARKKIAEMRQLKKQLSLQQRG